MAQLMSVKENWTMSNEGRDFNDSAGPPHFIWVFFFMQSCTVSIMPLPSRAEKIAKDSSDRVIKNGREVEAKGKKWINKYRRILINRSKEQPENTSWKYPASCINWALCKLLVSEFAKISALMHVTLYLLALTSSSVRNGVQFCGPR